MDTKRWRDTLPPPDATLAAKLDGALIAGLDRYFTDHIPTGSFLRAVLENDLHGAILRAHPQSLHSLADLVTLIATSAPAGSWGSCVAVDAWIRARTDAP